MKNVSGRYLSNVLAIYENKPSIAEMRVNNPMGNIISIEFNLRDQVMKLTGVISNEGDLVQIYIMDKYTEKYHIQGANLEGFGKTGVHGYINPGNQKLMLEVIINQYNENPINILFEGFLPGGSHTGKNLKEYKFFLSN